MSVDPLAAFGGQDSWSPYAAMGNNPAMMVDPLGLQFQGFQNPPTPSLNTNPMGFSDWALRSMGINLTRTDYGEYFTLSAQLGESEAYKRFVEHALRSTESSSNGGDGFVVKNGRGFYYDDQASLEASVTGTRQFPNWMMFQNELYCRVEEDLMGRGYLRDDISWYSWNGPIARRLVPDKLSVSIGGDFGFLVTAGVQPFNLTLLTRGTEPGFYVTPSANVNFGLAARVDGNINFSGGWFTGDPRNITSSMLTGHTLGINGSVTALAGVTGGVSYSPINPTNPISGGGFININIGLTGGIGASVSGHYQYIPFAGKLWGW